MTDAMIREWRPVEGFTNYEVSSRGEVRHVNRPTVHLKQYVLRGYARVGLRQQGRQKTASVNRLVCRAFHGPAPTATHHAAHNDGDKSNNCKDNLRWATPKENNADKVAHGTTLTGRPHWSVANPANLNKGERNGLAKLTEQDVVQIRQDERHQRIIAREYGVSQHAIWCVKSRATWRHVA